MTGSECGPRSQRLIGWTKSMAMGRRRGRPTNSGNSLARHFRPQRSQDLSLMIGRDPGEFVGATAMPRGAPNSGLPLQLVLLTAQHALHARIRVCPFGRMASAQVFLLPTPFCRRDTSFLITPSYQEAIELYSQSHLSYLPTQ